MAETNPHNDICKALWDLLEASEDFCAHVAVGNRIKHYGDNILCPDKPNRSTSDYPEVEIFDTQNKITPNAASGSWRVETRWEIRIHAGRQYKYRAWQVYWDIIKAMSHWETYVKDTVTYSSEKVVKNCYTVGSDSEPETAKNTKANQGIQNWYAVWACMTDVWVQESTIEAVPEEEE